MVNIVASYDTTTLDLLLEKVYREAGYNFRYYKRGTVIRRLERRLHATGAKTYLDYLQFLYFLVLPLVDLQVDLQECRSTCRSTRGKHCVFRSIF